MKYWRNSTKNCEVNGCIVSSLLEYKEGKEKEFRSVQALEPIECDQSKKKGLFFEVKITQKSSKGVFAIGLTTQKDFPTSTKLPGWLPGSFGYHSDDACFFNENGTGTQIGAKKFSTGEIIGCGVTKLGQIFFTCGTKIFLTTKRIIPKTKFYPLIGFDCEGTFVSNFGERKFTPDLTSHLGEEINQSKKKFEMAMKIPRYETHISLDKPIYKPGETLFFRAILINAHTFELFSSATAIFASTHKITLLAQYKILTPSKSTKSSGRLSEHHQGVFAGTYILPKDLSGGDYTLRIEYGPANPFPSYERTFSVREYTPRKLKMQLEFIKKGLGPGDHAQAKLSCFRANGEPSKKAKVISTALVDGKEIFKESSVLDVTGNSVITFRIPKNMKIGKGTLNCSVNDNEVLESIGKTIPILMQTVDVRFYPEGGELVAGVPCGLYFEVKTPYGEPADITGEIVDDRGNVLALAQTIHEGRGSTIFTPQISGKYSLRIRSPSGIKNKIPLPSIQKEGVSLMSTCLVYDGKGSLDMRVSSTTTGKYSLYVCKRERVISCIEFLITCVGEEELVKVSLPMGENISTGVLRVTVVDEKGIPRAERLVFVKAKNVLEVEIVTNKDKYSVGEKVTLVVNTKRKEDGVLVEGIAGVCVTDDTVLEMIEKRKQTPNLQQMVYLESNVKELEDCSVYFDDEDPVKAAQAIDLLLGTQGWRRFVFEDDRIEKFLNEYKDKAQQILCFKEFTPNTSDPFSSYGSAGGSSDLLDLFGTSNSINNNYHSAQYPSYQSNNLFGGSTQQNTSHNPFGAQLQGGYSQSPSQSFNSSFSFSSQQPANSNTTTPHIFSQQMHPSISLSQRQQSASPFSSRNYPQSPQQGYSSFGASPYSSQNYPQSPQQGYSSQAQGYPFGGQTQGGYSQGPSQSFGQTSEPGSSNRSDDVPFLFTPSSSQQQQQQQQQQQISDIFGSYQRNTNIPFSSAMRIYAHKRNSLTATGKREDFTDTVLWVAGEDLSQVIHSFNLSDSITGFKINVDVAAKDGSAFGFASKIIESTKPFFLDYKLPVEVSCGDMIEIPLALNNQSSKDLKDIEITGKISGTSVLIKGSDNTTKRLCKVNGITNENGLLPILKDKETARGFVQAKVGFGKEETLTVDFGAKNSEIEDSVSKNLRVVPSGFPFEINASGSLEKNTKVTHEFTLPPSVELSSVKTELLFYPSTVSNLTQALSRLIREPYGCFEQIASTSYPMVLAQQYFFSHSGVSDSLVNKAKRQIKKSYSSLMGYQLDSGSFSWFGERPANESLTAYGLLHFYDMDKVYTIERDLLQNIRKWLLSRRDGAGGFKRSPGKYGYGKANVDTTNAFICFALTETEESRSLGMVLKKEIDHLWEKRDEFKKSDPYILALLASILYNVKRVTEGQHIAYMLTEMIVDGCVGKNMNFSTITCYSYGEGNVISATSLALIAWMKFGKEFNKFISESMRWLLSNSKGGSFGDTQATILSLKAIIAYDERIAAQRNPGKIKVFLDDKEICSKKVNPTVKSNDPIAMDGFEHSLSVGKKHRIVLIQRKGFSLPYSVCVSYNSLKPSNSPNCNVKLSAKILKSDLVQGEGTQIKVSMINKVNEVLSMTVAIVGLPAGIDPRIEKLQELVKEGILSYYEIIGREVVLYLINMDKKQIVDIDLDVVAFVPGVYQGTASRIYLYYMNEYKYFVDPIRVSIRKPFSLEIDKFVSL